MTDHKFIYNYFLFLFSIIPITFLIGPAISLSNVILIDLSFVILIIYKKDYFFLKSKPIKYLLILYLYFILNSFLSVDYSIGQYRNFGFIRLIILFVAFNYFFFQKSFLKRMLISWLIVICVVLMDVFIEQFTGTNVFGFNFGIRFYNDQVQYGRIVSFFKDEPIVGGYLFGFYLILVGFLLNEFKNKKLLFVFAFMILIVFTIILTGERSNSIRAFFGFGLISLFISKFDLKTKIISLSSVVILIMFLIPNIKYLEIRFINNVKDVFLNHSIYFDIYKSASQVFENNKVFGVGNKNYRIETCNSKRIKEDNTELYHCQTHPHQFYLELISEHGIVGSFLILFILFKLIFSKIIKTFKKDNYLKMGSLIYMLLMFIPLLPTGAFFGDFLITIFIINLSIFYASDKSSNIFFQKNYK